MAAFTSQDHRALQPEELKLLSIWPSMFGLRVQLALELKGLGYKYKEEDLKIKSNELLHSNQVYKRIPVLIHKGKTICESLIIVEYIDNVWPKSDHPLFPRNPYDRSLARFWAEFGDRKVYEAVAKILKTKGEEQAAGVKEFQEALAHLERALSRNVPSEGALFGGSKMNFADISLAPFICWFQALEVIGSFTLPDRAKLPMLYKWIDAVKQDRVAKKVLPKPDKVLEFAQDMRKQFVQ